MGKGGGKQHTPYEAPNDLTSRQKLSIIDLVSEGPIEGPLGDLQGVHLNDTPVIDQSGNSSVNGLTAQWVAGTLEQPAMDGFAASSSENPVGVEVKQNAPVTRTITSRNIDRLRLTFGTQTLVEVKDNGDRVPTTVELQVQIQRGGSWVTEKHVTIRGKRSNSPYLMAVIIDKLPPPPFGVRLVRITQDSNSDKLQNTTFWSSYTEITDITQTYPGSAVVGLTFESEQFGNRFPRRNYLVKGRIIQVPDNYNPETRTYTGIWSGHFKPAYTNNPAWVLWDLLTHPRYGMGRRLNIAEIDKFALYVIGQYCDQFVPDGFGGEEPRMTCNAYITDLRKAYEVISDLSSMMRIMPVWNGQQLTFIQDRPADIAWPYTNANVVNGRFNYSFSPLKARHTVVEVRFIDPGNGWKTSIEQVSDDELVARFGRNVLRVDAFGCTSRGQAHRHGLWILATEKLETQTVEFSLGSEGLRHVPGDIIEVADTDYADTQIGGRITHIDWHTNRLTLDRNIEPPKKGQAFVSLLDGRGQPQSLPVMNYPASNQIKLEQLPQGLADYSVWTLTLPSLRRRLFRAISLADNGNGTFTVTAVQHVPEKEAVVDKGEKFEPKPDTAVSGFIPPVENLAVEVTPDSESWQVEATWNSPYTTRGIDFLLKLTMGDRIVGTASTAETLYRFGGLPQGNYQLSVVPQNDRGQKGTRVTTAFSINPPPAPTYIEVEPGYFSLGFIPRSGGQNSFRAQYEFWFSDKQITDIRDVESRAEYLGTGTMWIVQGRRLKAGYTYYVYVRSVNAVGRSEFVEGSGQPDDNTPEIVEKLGNQFLSAEAGKRLQSDMNWNAESALILTNAQQQLSRELMVRDGESKAQISELWSVRATDNEAWAQKITEVNSSVGVNASRIKTVETTIAERDKSFGQQFTEIRTSMRDVAADVVTNKQAISSTQKAVAESAQQVQAQFGEQQAIINSKMQAEFNQSGNGYAIHNVNITINRNGTKYNAGGMVISGEFKNGSLESYIGFSANNFAFFNPANGKLEPFMAVKNGQVFIRDGFIDKGYIREIILSDAIRSKNYVQYMAGFLINAVTGAFEFNDMRSQAGLRWANGAIACYDQNGRVRAAMGYIGQFR
ncbi:host specificity protein J [Xenorhabdus thuongxuanensis]|uniref:Host specificity protein J n=1 Tax=Xenorhabdus thuongxuanensis TaxID=1873484 RepID=A0A1Q5U3Q9_9GAMM|nr:host specificity protein J [Xenorhabdus thuongxuanensis]OKP07111.1 host specificity protein J [Xenorhabdus thuongxuanensis]